MCVNTEDNNQLKHLCSLISTFIISSLIMHYHIYASYDNLDSWANTHFISSRPWLDYVVLDQLKCKQWSSQKHQMRQVTAQRNSFSVKEQKRESKKNHQIWVLLHYAFIIVKYRPVAVVITLTSLTLITKLGISSSLIGNFLLVTFVLCGSGHWLLIPTGSVQETLGIRPCWRRKVQLYHIYHIQMDRHKQTV